MSANADDKDVEHVELNSSISIPTNNASGFTCIPTIKYNRLSNEINKLTIENIKLQNTIKEYIKKIELLEDDNKLLAIEYQRVYGGGTW